MTPPSAIGRYRIHAELGRGGMGVVYRAFDPELERQVAVKLILLPADASREARDELEKRFRREAKAAARIRHSGVVAIFDVGVTETGLFLVMELVEGDSLARRLERGEFPPRESALELAAQAADALAAAHRAGVVHRDVKPANILLSPDGRVMLTDFGVARSLDEVSELTRTGMVVGSPAYMAPEQLQGAAVDGRADLFSLGVVLYELLLRRRPFPAQSITTLLYQILHEDPLADPELTRLLDPAAAEVLRLLLAKRPDERFADAVAVAAALRALPPSAPSTWPDPEAATQRRTVVGGPPPPPPPGPPALPLLPPPTPPPLPVSSGAGAGQAPGGSRHLPVLLWLGLGAAGGAVVLAAGLVAWWQGRPERPVIAPRGPVAAWDPAAPGALPEPSYAVTGTPPPLPSPSPGIGVALPMPQPMPQPTPSPTPLVTPSPPPAAVATPRVFEPAPLPTPLVIEVDSSPPAEPEPPRSPPAREPQIEPEPPIPEDLRFTCRHGMELDVGPSRAELSINGRVLGQARHFEEHVFEGPGRYLLRLTFPEHHPAAALVVVDPRAEDKWCDIEIELEEIE